jgi:hypothetical protein
MPRAWGDWLPKPKWLRDVGPLEDVDLAVKPLVFLPEKGLPRWLRGVGGGRRDDESFGFPDGAESPRLEETNGDGEESLPALDKGY